MGSEGGTTDSPVEGEGEAGTTTITMDVVKGAGPTTGGTDPPISPEDQNSN